MLSMNVAIIAEKNVGYVFFLQVRYLHIPQKSPKESVLLFSNCKVKKTPLVLIEAYMPFTILFQVNALHSLVRFSS